MFSRRATGVQLLLFEGVDDTHAARVIRLDPSANRTYHYWHVFVPDVRPGQLYAYRVEGPFDPSSGMRFDPTKVLLDPYGRGVMVPEGYSRDAAQGPGDNAGTAMKSVVIDVSAYDWEGDASLRRPSSQTIVYEMHVGGFTRHPSSGLAGKDARHIRRSRRKNPLSEATRHHGGGAVAGVPVRPSGLPARAGQLLGLRARVVLRASPGL